jgi:PAS domain S-box-containing protein
MRASACWELLAAGRRIASSLDPCVVLETAAEEATHLLHGNAAAILECEGDALRVAVTHQLPGDVLAHERDLIRDVRALGAAAGLDGCVSTPLVIREETIGTVAVYGDHPHSFEDTAGELLAMLADLTAIAFDNARVHHEGERRAAALRESEERFRLAFDEAPIGVALVGLDGRFLRVNNALCEIVGYAREELTDKTFQSITHPDDLDLDLDLAGKLARGEIPRYQLAKRYLHKDGRVVDIMLSGSIVRSPEGAPLYYISQIEDISDRKRAEEQLRQSQERYELALAGADLASWDWDVPTGHVVLNVRWAEMRGYRLEELRPHVDTWAADVHPDDLPDVQRALDAHFAGRTPFYETEHRVRSKSGDWIWILDRGRVFTRGEDGRPLRMVGTELDITARKRLESEHARALERQRAILEVAPVGIAISSEGTRWRVNERGQQLLDMRVDEPAATTAFVGRILDARHHAIAYEELPGVRAQRGERLDALELSLLRPDGTCVPVLCNAAPIPTAPDEPSAAVVTFEDISTMKELERLRTEWSSIVAHDLRQPVSSIHLAADLVAEQLRDHPIVRRRVLQIRESARRLERMIQDLLDFSLLEARQLQLHREERDLTSLVKDVIERLRLEDPQRPMSVLARGPTATVDVDPDRLEQILENLVSNALKYGTPCTPIHVGLETKPTTVAVWVTNQGCGITPEHQAHVFDRFRTVDEARRVGVKGIGLGLYITRELVEAHGGQITVDSTPGETTTFKFVLPLARPSTSVAPALHA